MQYIISFLNNHEEAIITTIIGIIASIVFYIIAKKDGEKSYDEYKRLYTEGQKEIKLLQIKLDKTESNNNVHHEDSKRFGLIISNIDQKFDSKSEGKINDELFYTKINSLLAAKKFEEAENYLNGKREFITNIPMLRSIEGLIELNRGHIDKALSIFNGITESYEPEEILHIDRLYALKGDIYCQYYNDLTMGVREFEKAYELQKDISYLTKIAELYSKLGFVDHAEKFLCEAKILNAEDPSYLVTSSEFNLRKRNYIDALKDIEKAITLKGFNASYEVQKAVILNSMGRKKEAINVCKQAYKSNPSFKFALYNLSNFYIEDKNYIQGEICIEQYFKLYPNDIFALGTYFYILDLLGQSKKIIAVSKQYPISHLSRQCHSAANTLGLTYIKLDNFQKANECFSSILTFYPNHVPALEAMSLMYIFNKENRNLLKAEEYCDKILLRHEPSNVNALNNKGLIRLITKRFKEANEYFQKAYEINPNSKTTMGNIRFCKHIKKFFILELKLNSNTNLN